jgi:hypothetical protein
MITLPKPFPSIHQALLDDIAWGNPTRSSCRLNHRESFTFGADIPLNSMRLPVALTPLPENS